MDPEQTFLRVHARLSGMFLRVLTPKVRAVLEYAHLIVAVALFCSLVIMHINFVQQPGCSSELAGIEIDQADLVHIKISSAGTWSQDIVGKDTPSSVRSLTEGVMVLDVEPDGLPLLAARRWLNWIFSGTRKNKLTKSWKNDNACPDSHVADIADASGTKNFVNAADCSDSKKETADVNFIAYAKESFKMFAFEIYMKYQKHYFSLWEKVEAFSRKFHTLLRTAGDGMVQDLSKWSNMRLYEGFQTFLVRWLERRSKELEPTYLYTVEKGYFWLSEEAKSKHNIRAINITISGQHSCFGNRWQQLLLNSFIGYDTILINSLLNFPGQGYLYNYQTREIYDLNFVHESTDSSIRFHDYFVTKCGVLIMSLFVFFTTTMSVSFTLRETQSRMLKFTVQLQHHARYRLPTFQLVFVHVIESLVFVPIMIGTLFFLFEFYHDQLLAFMVLVLVWMCELFTLISVRTPLSIQFFPRFFLLYFLVFHIYFFSYTYGFSYLAFATTSAFMHHLILYFWNHFEVPALEILMQNQQQSGIHITSSIVTSTLHIARVNVRNPVAEENEFEPDQGGESMARTVGSENDEIQRENQEMMTSPTHRTTPGVQQPTASPGSSSLNPYSSLLLGMLGGGTDGSVPFFSTFRDVRDESSFFRFPWVRRRSS